MLLPTAEESQSFAELLGYLRINRVNVWVENGLIRYKAPKGLLGPRELTHLKLSKNRIMELLERHQGQHTTWTVGASYAPPAFSQLAHWNVYRLAERPSIRQIAHAIRISGPLQTIALEESIGRVIRRHDALRTRILTINDLPIQAIGNAEPLRVDEVKLPHESNPRQGASDDLLTEIIDDFLLQKVHVSRDPLFAARLVRLRKCESVLIMGMEHMISDAYSLGVVTREIFADYICSVNGKSSVLPDVRVQFPDFAARQWHSLPRWLESCGALWHGRLSGFRRPEIHGALKRGQDLGWGTAPITIDDRLKKRLSDWSRARQTTVAMTVLTAYVALVMRWCGTSRALVKCQTDGRLETNMEHSVGYFASVLYLDVVCRQDDSLMDLLSRVVEGYCEACINADQSLFESRVPRPEFTNTFWFNWVPETRGLDFSVLRGAENAIAYHLMEFEHPMLRVTDRDNDPLMLLYERESGVTGGIHFPRNRFGADHVCGVRDYFMKLLGIMLEAPNERINRLSTI